MIYRYILHPGRIGPHFIGEVRLRELYHLSPKDHCVVLDKHAHGYRERPGDVHLYPDPTGQYKRPAPIPEPKPQDDAQPTWTT